MSVRLRPRLAGIAQMLRPFNLSSIADVGCDHGKLTAALLQGGIAEHVFASDISEESLMKARELIKKCGLEASVTFECASGLSYLSQGQAEAAVLAGMGGELIARLISESFMCCKSMKAIVMQPMRGVEELRLYLYTNGFSVFDERIIYDAGRYYQLIAAKPGIMTFPPNFPQDCYNYGPLSLEKRDPLLYKLLNRDLDGVRKRIAQAAQKGVELPALRAEEAQITCLLGLYEKGCGYNEEE